MWIEIIISIVITLCVSLIITFVLLPKKSNGGMNVIGRDQVEGDDETTTLKEEMSSDVAIDMAEFLQLDTTKIIQNTVSKYFPDQIEEKWRVKFPAISLKTNTLYLNLRNDTTTCAWIIMIHPMTNIDKISLLPLGQIQNTKELYKSGPEDARVISTTGGEDVLTFNALYKGIRCMWKQTIRFSERQIFFEDPVKMPMKFHGVETKIEKNWCPFINLKNHRLQYIYRFRKEGQICSVYDPLRKKFIHGHDHHVFETHHRGSSNLIFYPPLKKYLGTIHTAHPYRNRFVLVDPDTFICTYAQKEILIEPLTEIQFAVSLNLQEKDNSVLLGIDIDDDRTPKCYSLSSKYIESFF